MGRKNVNAQSRAMISRLDTCLFVMLSQKLFAALTPTSMQRKNTIELLLQSFEEDLRHIKQD